MYDFIISFIAYWEFLLQLFHHKFPYIIILIFRIAIFQILSNPFEDIVPRVNAEDRKSKDSKEEKVKSKSKATKYAIYCHF